MEKYKFREYDKKFQELFKREKTKLRKIMPNSQIEHIGSTAVKGLGGKGIIDILIAVPNEQINKVKNKLIKNKYKFGLTAGDKNRLFFEKDYKYNGGIRRVHIQLTSNNSNVWKKSIYFRDYLIKNKKEAKRYETMKLNAAKICEGEGKIYKEYKEKFFKELDKE